MAQQLPSLQGAAFLLIGIVSGFIIGVLNLNFLDFRERARYRMVTSDSALVLASPSSHLEVQAIDAIYATRGWPTNNLSEDSISHNDDDSTAKTLFDRVRVLVFVETYPANLETKARLVNDTWGKRANKILYASDEYDPSFPTMNISVETGRGHLTAKTMRAFDYIYKRHLNEYDWFMKADDDTYVIMENLRYFLSNEDTNEPVFFGHWFKTKTEQGYYSGGGGYVLSREALRRFGQREPTACKNDTGAEDVAFGHCMLAVGVRTKSSLDSLGRSRFHGLNPKRMLSGRFPGWYVNYDKYNASHMGVDGLSDYTISFHYCTADVMYQLEYFTYHLKPYGIRTGMQHLNVDYSKYSSTLDTEQNAKIETFREANAIGRETSPEETHMMDTDSTNEQVSGRKAINKDKTSMLNANRVNSEQDVNHEINHDKRTNESQDKKKAVESKVEEIYKMNKSLIP